MGEVVEPDTVTTTANTYSAYGHRVISRTNLMDMFRGDKQTAALLTWNYDSAG